MSFEKGLLHQSILDENSAQIETLLQAAEFESEVNTPNAQGLSPLYLALSLGYMKKHPDIIKQFLAKGAVIKNGKILKPEYMPKLLTRYANARNLQYIFKKYLEYCQALQGDDLILEIGSGDGYLKYLIGLCNDITMDKIRTSIVETEIASEIVNANRLKGKEVIQAGLDELENYFPRTAFAAVVSLNILDILDDRELKKGISILHRLIRKKGMLLHIMSSAVHKLVFQNIKNHYKQYAMLPYYKDGNVGVRLVRHKGNSLVESFNTGPEELALLFAKKPQKYIELSEKVTEAFLDIGDPGILILLRDFSIWRIAKALEQHGFRIVHCEEIASNTLVECNEYHQFYPDCNSFTNIVGSLLTDTSESVEAGKVMEKSTFVYLMVERK